MNNSNGPVGKTGVEQISAMQYLMLGITYVIATADVFLPAFVAQEGKNDSWISVIIGTISSILIANIFITLGLRHPDKTIIEYSCDILGKFLGKLVGLSYVYLFLHIAWVVTRELEEIFVIAFNPSAPILVYGIAVIIVATYAVFNGLEVIARINEILLPLGLGVLLFIAFINAQNMDFTRFLPVLYDGFIPPLRGGLLVQTSLIELVFMLQIIPFIKQKQKIRKYTNICLIVLGLGLQVGALTIAVFGSDLTGKLLFPALEYVRLASFGPYIQNLDISIMIVWISGIFIKIALSYYLSATSLSQLLGFKSYKNIIIPLGVVITVFSIASGRMLSELIHFMKYILPFYFLFMSLVLPGILLIVSLIRGKKVSEKTSVRT